MLYVLGHIQHECNRLSAVTSEVSRDWPFQSHKNLHQQAKISGGYRCAKFESSRFQTFSDSKLHLSAKLTAVSVVQGNVLVTVTTVTDRKSKALLVDPKKEKQKRKTKNKKRKLAVLSDWVGCSGCSERQKCLSISSEIMCDLSFMIILFTAPHLVWARSAYTDRRIRSFYHMRTNTQTHTHIHQPPSETINMLINVSPNHDWQNTIAQSGSSRRQDNPQRPTTQNHLL